MINIPQVLVSYLLLSTLFGCGGSDNKRKNQLLQAKMTTGRRVARNLPVVDSDSNLMLTGSSDPAGLLGFKTAQDSDLVIWSLFDTEKREDIAWTNLANNALSFIDSHTDMFQVSQQDLGKEPLVIEISHLLVSVSFPRLWQGIPVRDAHIELIYSKQPSGHFRLREVVNSTHGRISVANDQGTPPSWDDVRALYSDTKLEQLFTRNIIFTKNSTREGELVHTVATEFTVKDSTTGISSVVTLEHDTKELLEAYQNLYTATPLPLTAAVFKRTYLDADKVFKPLRQIQVVAGNNRLKSDLDGLIDLTGLSNITLQLTSERGQINLAAANAAYQINAQVTNNDGYSFSPTGDGLTALNAYTALLDINRFVRKNINPTESTILGQNTVTRINVRGSCNAFYDPQISGISLFAAGNGCANIAQINDVIYHEWGHGLDNFTGKTAGITDGAFSEGIGDIVSGFRTNSSVLAPGFLVNDATGIRNLDNTSKYPDNRGEVHVEGQIIGGAFWDMRKGLIERYGPLAGAEKAETIFFRHLLTTDTYLDSYQAALRLNDEDGNPATPEPDHCLINAAFAKHGLAQSESCQDNLDRKFIPIDESLAVGILKSDDAGFLLMASSAKGQQMSICLDTKQACLASGKQDFIMEREGTLNGKTTFLTGQPLKIKPLQTLTFISKDSSGKTIGVRMVRLVTK